MIHTVPLPSVEVPTTAFLLILATFSYIPARWAPTSPQINVWFKEECTDTVGLRVCNNVIKQRKIINKHTLTFAFDAQLQFNVVSRICYKQKPPINSKFKRRTSHVPNTEQMKKISVLY